MEPHAVDAAHEPDESFAAAYPCRHRWVGR
jgi:hypothetical protein